MTLSVVVVRRHFFGDALLALAAVRNLVRHTRAVVDFVIDEKYADACRGETYLRDVIGIPTSLDVTDVHRTVAHRAYDAAVTLHVSDPGAVAVGVVTAANAAMRIGFSRTQNISAGLDHLAPFDRVSGEPMLRSFLRLLAPLGASTEELDPALELGGRGERPQPLMSEQVVLLPGARRTYARWPVERFAQVAIALLGAGRTVLAVGHATEREIVQRVADLGPGVVPVTTGSILDLASILRSSRRAIGNLSGMSLLAAAAGCPVIAVNGHCDRRVWRPLGAGHVVLEASPSGACLCATAIEDPRERYGVRNSPCTFDLRAEAVIACALNGQPSR